MKFLTFCCMVMLLGCQPKDTTVTSNGKVLLGEQAGSEFVIAAGDEDEKMMETIEAFNNMDMDGLWEHMADTVTFHMADGFEGPFTKEMMAGFMAEADSVQWEVMSIIPVQAKGSNSVRVLLDSHEKIYMKDGSVVDKKLFEEFIFEEGTVVKIRQWDAATAMEGSE
ncbi:MAG: hypothetical protein U5J95_01090 [Balneolaceae bacterium]|nr:hypothetical protein [Balneolaceae bacterium]